MKILRIILACIFAFATIGAFTSGQIIAGILLAIVTLILVSLNSVLIPPDSKEIDPTLEKGNFNKANGRCKLCGTNAKVSNLNENGYCINCQSQINFEEKAKLLKEQIESINKELEDKNKLYREIYDKSVGDATADLDNIINEKNNRIKELNNKIKELNGEVIVSYTFEDIDFDITSEEYKSKISMCQVEQKQLVADGKAVVIIDNFNKTTTNNNNIKQAIRLFNTECDNIMSSLTFKKIDSSRAKLQRSFEQLNRLFKTDFICISNEYLELKFDELNYLCNYMIQKERELDEQKAIKEQMLEEEKVRREIENEKKRIEKEQSQFKSEVDKLMKYMAKTDNDVEKQLYIDKIKELEEKLNLLEKDKDNVLQREQNTRAGFVYIISNIGSFGENVYKIGMTRRLEPMDRIKELSSASVPFEFDVHAMIFSEDAPALETTLHTTFKDYQVNKINPRKEFFKVDLGKIKEVVLKEHNATVHFTMVADANEYRESLKMAEKKTVLC